MTERAADKPAGATAQTQTQTAAHSIPEDLRPLVQQQLDAVATQRLAWHGEVWPGQNMDWKVQWDHPPAGQGRQEDEQASAWSTTVSLTTPRLGRIEATLQLAGGGVRIALVAPDGGSAADLRQAAPALAAALDAAGIPLSTLQVSNEEA
jgi:flagellar hook-length control protein FliK